MPKKGKHPSGIRFLGIDDSPFSQTSRKVLVVGVMWRNGTVEGILSTRISKDGADSTAKIAKMISNSRFAAQVRVILTNSVTMAGFNVIDINKLSKQIRVPVICLARRNPDMDSVFSALGKIKSGARKKKLIEKAGKVYPTTAGFAQFAGISPADGASILKQFKSIPEPIRLAHLIGGGVVKGESSGRA